MRKKRNIKSRTGSFFLAVAILVPLIGICAGYLLSQKIIIPYLSENRSAAVKQTSTDIKSYENQQRTAGNEESESGAVYENMCTIEGFTFYRIQAGAFSNRENASKLAGQLVEKGIESGIRDEGLYKVFTNYAFNRKSIESRLQAIKEDLPEDAHISVKEYPSVVIRFPKAMAYQAETMYEQLQQVRGMLEDIVDSITAGEDAGILIKTNNDRIHYFKQQLDKLDLAEPLSQYYGKMQKMYEDLLEVYLSYDGENSGYIRFSMELVDIYEKFFDDLSNML